MAVKTGRRCGVAVAIGLAAFTVAFSVARSGAAAAYEEGQPVTLVLPPAACQEVERRNDQQDSTAYEVDVTLASRGGLVLGGDPAWRSLGLPLVAAGQITSIKSSKRAKQTTLTFEGDGTTAEIRVPMEASWQQPLEEILIPGHSSVAEPSAALTASLDGMFEAYCNDRFAAPLDALEPRIRRRVAELQFAIRDFEAPSTSTFEGEVYFDARLGEGTVVYNRTSSTQSQRVTNTITDRVLPAVKAWAQVFFGEVPFHGFRVMATITDKDFTKYPPKPEYDQLELYVPLDDAEKYAADDLSMQQILDASVVLLNGSPYRVNLADVGGR